MRQSSHLTYFQTLLSPYDETALPRLRLHGPRACCSIEIGYSIPTEFKTISRTCDLSGGNPNFRFVLGTSHEEDGCYGRNLVSSAPASKYRAFV